LSEFSAVSVREDTPRPYREQPDQVERLTEWTYRVTPDAAEDPRQWARVHSQFGGVMPGTLTSPPLTAADRCDRCSAGARVRAVLASGGELLFCQHHANEHADRLREMNATIVSDSEESAATV